MTPIERSTSGNAGRARAGTVASTGVRRSCGKRFCVRAVVEDPVRLGVELLALLEIGIDVLRREGRAGRGVGVRERIGLESRVERHLEPGPKPHGEPREVLVPSVSARLDPNGRSPLRLPGGTPPDQRAVLLCDPDDVGDLRPLQHPRGGALPVGLRSVSAHEPGHGSGAGEPAHVVACEGDPALRSAPPGTRSAGRVLSRGGG
jgi:hypothetical protein